MSYLTYFEKSPARLQVVEAAGKILAISDDWLRDFGYHRSEVIGQSWANFITPETHERTLREYAPLLQTQPRLTELACEFVQRNGARREMLASVVVEYHFDGTISHYLIALQDIQTPKRVEQLLLAAATSLEHGLDEDFFPTLVSHLATAFQVRYALATACINPALARVRTLAYIDRSDLLENIEYDLVGTPCAGVIAGSVCYYPEKLTERFSMDLNEESYLGVPLFNSQGQVIGHLALLDDKPMACNPWEIALMQNFAVQAALALENAYLRQQVMQTSALEERGRLTRAMHDSVTQSLFSLSLLTAGWQRLLRNGQQADPDAWLTELNTISQQALREMRTLIDMLQTPARAEGVQLSA